MNAGYRLMITVLALAGTCAGRPAAGGDFELPWSTLDCGGGTMSGGAWTASVTIGQPDAGEMSGGGFDVTGGFWTDEGAIACPGDLDGSGDIAFGDILAVLSAWGPCDACPEDIDGSGAVDFGDLLFLLGAWGACPS